MAPHRSKTERRTVQGVVDGAPVPESSPEPSSDPDVLLLAPPSVTTTVTATGYTPPPSPPPRKRRRVDAHAQGLEAFMLSGFHWTQSDESFRFADFPSFSPMRDVYEVMGL